MEELLVSEKYLYVANVPTESGLDPLPLPSYQSDGAAGVDLQANESIVIPANSHKLVHTGIKVSIPMGYEGQVRSRSGLALRYAVSVLNSPGTIDSDYRGEICVILINHSKEDFAVKRGDRIAQLVFAPIARFELVRAVDADMATTKRGEGGFGSTGI
jgi:dUTP pyrophosphatase